MVEVDGERQQSPGAGEKLKRVEGEANTLHTEDNVSVAEQDTDGW